MSYQTLRAHSEDVHRRIFHSHLAYLNQEETPSKLEQRHALESLIIEFLSLVPHDEKFSSPGIENILSQSINDNSNFSAYKAASAFEALEKYATNLLSHPWRKEYKVVKLYSGFYKHSVESQLFGGGALFLLLGYEQNEDGVLYLDEPVDPDKVARVALDCLKAYVECQIMLQICEKVKIFKCTWPEILNVREEYVCGIDEAVRILQQLKRTALDQSKQDRWLASRENGTSREKHLIIDPESSCSQQKTDILIDVSNNWSSSTTPQVCFSEDVLIPQSSHHIGSYPSKSSKRTLYTHTKLPSWSEGVSSKANIYSSRAEEAGEHLPGTFDDHIQANYSLIDGSKCSINSGFPASLDLISDREDSWDLLNLSVQKSPYQGNRNRFGEFEQNSHRSSGSVPKSKIPYTSQYAHSLPSSHMLPMGVPGYPCPLPQELNFPPRQCQHHLCCEQHIPIIPSSLHHKDTSTYGGLDKQFNMSERSPINVPLDINSDFYQLSIDRHGPLPKPTPFPVDGPTYNLHQTVSHSTIDGASLRLDGATTSKQFSKRASFYDNVPTTLETDIVNTSFNNSSQSLITKSDPHVIGTLSFNSLTMSNRPTNQKAVVASESLGSSVTTKSAQPKILNSENCSGIEINNVQEGSTAVVSNEAKNAKLPSTARRDYKDCKKWSCTSCTFYNNAEKSICDMCGRSKYPGPESTPLVSGGRECPQCTLVNRKDSEDCTACGTSLKDSPTYI